MLSKIIKNIFYKIFIIFTIVEFVFSQRDKLIGNF